MRRSHYIPWIYNLDFKVSPEFIRFLPLVLLMVQKSPTTTWNGAKTCKQWDKLPTSTGERRIFEPPTVSTRNCHGSGSGDPQRWWHWLRARLWLKSLGFRNHCVFLNKSIFGRHLFLANICIHQSKHMNWSSCWIITFFMGGWNIPLFKQWIFFAPSRRLAFETTHLRNSLVGDLDHEGCNIVTSGGLDRLACIEETKHRKMFRFCWKQNLSTCWRFLKCAAIKEELKSDSLMLWIKPSWERSRIPYLKTLFEFPWFSVLPVWWDIRTVSSLEIILECKATRKHSYSGYWLRFQSCQSRDWCRISLKGSPCVFGSWISASDSFKKLVHSCWVPPCATGTTEDM